MPYKTLSSASQYEALLDAHDTWLFDCDGVLWSGDEAIAGAVEAVALLRQRGKQVIFVTNNASKSRQALLGKFRKMGIEAETVSTLAADGLKGAEDGQALLPLGAAQQA